MIITLKGANFSTNNINDLLNTFSVSYSGTGVTGTPRSIQKENGVATESLSATITIASNYTYESLTVRVGGNLLTAGTDYTVSGTGPVTLSIDAAKITGNVVVSVQTSSTGGDVVDPDEPITVAYTSRQSASGISKTTGEYLSSTTGYVNVYENIDPLKAYAATSYAPVSSGDSACVCYCTSDGTFISAESGSDWGISSVEYTMMQLTVPANASTIKLFGRTNNQEAVLYLTTAIVMDEITHTSQNTKSNLNKSNGTLGTSSTGYVNVYDNIDTSKTYYASGFAPNATGTAAAVCYYTSNGTFISAQDGNDFGVSSAGFVKQKLTVPSTTSTIKIFAQEQSAYPSAPSAALYVER